MGKSKMWHWKLNERVMDRIPLRVWQISVQLFYLRDHLCMNVCVFYEECYYHFVDMTYQYLLVYFVVKSKFLGYDVTFIFVREKERVETETSYNTTSVLRQKVLNKNLWPRTTQWVGPHVAVLLVSDVGTWDPSSSLGGPTRRVSRP